MTGRVASIFRYLFKKEAVERELDMEVAYHVDRQTEENIHRGMRPAEARRAADGAEPDGRRLGADCVRRSRRSNWRVELAFYVERQPGGHR